MGVIVRRCLAILWLSPRDGGLFYAYACPMVVNHIKISGMKILSLTPKKFSENNLYVDELKSAINNKNVHKIALSGEYGVGKSSILEDIYQDKCLSSKVKRISCIRLNSNVLSNASVKDESKSTKNGVADTEKAIRESRMVSEYIQKSVVSQLFYGEVPGAITGSRYRRIGQEVPKYLTISASLILFPFIAASWLDLVSRLVDIVGRSVWFTSLMELPPVCFFCLVVVMILPLTALLIAATVIAKQVLNTISSQRIKAVKFTSLEVDLNDGRADFDQFKDEIINFFRVMPYETVTFEDIDRFNNIEIFEELNDLNDLLNASIKDRKITFIYAVRDSLIPDAKERAKLFDEIIPIIPFLSSENMGEYTKDLFREAGIIDKLSSSDARTISNAISAQTTDARSIMLIVNMLATQLECFGGDNCWLGYKDDPDINLHVAGMATLKELRPVEYNELRMPAMGTIDGLFDKCNARKKLAIEGALKDRDDKLNEERYVENAVDTIIANVKRKSGSNNPQYNYIHYGDGGIDKMNEIDKKRLWDSLKDRKVAKLTASQAASSPYDRAFTLDDEMRGTEPVSKLLKLEQASLAIYESRLDNAQKDDAWKYLDEIKGEIKEVDKALLEMLEDLCSRGMLSEKYRLYVSPIKNGSGYGVRLLEFKYCFLMPLISSPTYELSDDDIEELLPSLNIAELASRTMYNDSIVEYIFSSNFDNDEDAKYLSALICDKSKGELLELFDYTKGYIRRILTAGDKFASISRAMEAGDAIDMINNDPSLQFINEVFCNYPDDFLSAVWEDARITTNRQAATLMFILWLNNTSEDATFDTNVVLDKVNERAIVINGLGYHFASILKNNGVVIDDLALFDHDSQMEMDMIVEQWNFELTKANLKYVSLEALDFIANSRGLSGDDVQALLSYGNSGQISITIDRLNAVATHSNTIDSLNEMPANEIVRCAIRNKKCILSKELLNWAATKASDNLIIEYAHVQKLEVDMVVDVLKKMPNSKFHKLVDRSVKQVTIVDNDDNRWLLSLLENSGYVKRFTHNKQGKLVVKIET